MNMKRGMPDDIVLDGLTEEELARIPVYPLARPLPDAAREGVGQVLGVDPAVPGSERSLIILNGDDYSALVDQMRAEGAAAERARIRQMALDEAARFAVDAGDLDEVAEGYYAQALRDFAALLEKP